MIVRDIACIVGAACLIVAGSEIHPALAWAAAGCLLLIVAVGAHRVAAARDDE